MTTPLIVSTSIADNQTGILIDTTIVFEFNTGLDSSTVNAGNFSLMNQETLEPVPVDVSYNSDTFKVTLLPKRAMRQLTSYLVTAIGIDNGSASWVTSSGGDPLLTTSQINFRTAQERYVPLAEVTDITDVEAVGPLRVVSATTPPTATTTTSTEIEIVSSSPASLASQVAVDSTGICILLNYPASGIDTSLITIESYPVLGIEEYYGAEDGTGLVWLNDACAPTGTYIKAGATGNYIIDPPVFSQPTGSYWTTGNYLYWDKLASDPWMYNSEIHFVFDDSMTLVSNAGVTGSLSAEIETIFTTEYFPKFLDARFLRLELGRAVVNVLDDTLNRIIHKNSIDAWEQAAGHFDIDAPYPAVRRYVKAASIMDVIDAVSLAQGMILGGESKQLGDWKHDRNMGGKNVADMMHPIYQKAQKEKERWLLELRAYRNQTRPRVAEKGRYAHSTPYDERRRTWDHWHSWTLDGLYVNADGSFAYNDGAPAANTVDHRAFKIQGYSAFPGLRYTYITQDGTTSRALFKCRST